MTVAIDIRYEITAYAEPRILQPQLHTYLSGALIPVLLKEAIIYINYIKPRICRPL